MGGHSFQGHKATALLSGFVFFFWSCRSMRDLSSLTTNGTRAHCSGNVGS